jgi:hypothetical protein
MRIEPVVNRVLRPLKVRLIRSARLAKLTETCSLQAERLAALERQCHSLEDRSRSACIVPIDHPDVVRPRPSNYRYSQIDELFRQHADRMNQFLDDVRPFLDHACLESITDDKMNETDPYWQNGYFGGGDARLAYAVAARFNPSNILEIGCGNSTKFFRKAIRDHGLRSRLIAIDPAPRAEISKVADETIRCSVLDVDPAVFRRLEPGDILFFDGSHITLNGTDVVHFFLEVLPKLPADVFVHIHDICLPDEYIELFTSRGYSEQYVLATLLLHSPSWVPLAPVRYLRSQGRIPHDGVSFWMKQTARAASAA